MNKGFKVTYDKYANKVQLNNKDDPFIVTRLTLNEAEEVIQDMRKAMRAIRRFNKRWEKELNR